VFFFGFGFFLVLFGSRVFFFFFLGLV